MFSKTRSQHCCSLAVQTRASCLISLRLYCLPSNMGTRMSSTDRGVLGIHEWTPVRCLEQCLVDSTNCITYMCTCLKGFYY